MVNRPWVLPWPSSTICSDAAAWGVGFLACEDGGFVGVAGGGVEDVEESFAQDAEGFGVVGVGLVEQEPLAVGGDGGVDVVG